MPSENFEKKEIPYKNISPTAWGVAYRRTLTDISYSQEIFNELESIVKQTRTPEELENLERLKFTEMTPMFEARYKLVDRLLKENHADQILEIAAGFSQHGIAMADNQEIQYVELDLPPVMQEKESIVKNLRSQSKIPAQSNLHFVAGDALQAEDLAVATKFFQKKPIAVMNEGLLRYLTFEQKRILAKHIHGLLLEFGGVWITPDKNLKTHRLGQSTEKMQQQNIRMNSMAGADLSENLFESEEVARTFFEEIGFSIERHPFSEVADQLVSPEKLGLSPEQVSATIGDLFVYVMRPKAS